jgi:hypothetical protein
MFFGHLDGEEKAQEILELTVLLQCLLPDRALEAGLEDNGRLFMVSGVRVFFG